jgi:hypothetical protein
MPTPSWINLLQVAAVAVRTASEPDPLQRAATGLRLAWITEAAVQGADPSAELWWQRLAEAICDTAADVDQLLPPPGVQLGTGPGPSDCLPDTPELRNALSALLSAAQDALGEYARRALSGRARLTAALAATTAGNAVPTTAD